MPDERIEGQPESTAQKPRKKKFTRRTPAQMQAARDVVEAKKIRAEAKKIREEAKVEAAMAAEAAKPATPPVTEEAKPVAPPAPAKPKADFSMDVLPEDGPTAAELKEAARLKKENQSFERIRDEIKIRRYVKKDGGWRKGVSPAQRNATIVLLRKLGRDRPVWDRTIIATDRYDGKMETEAQVQERKSHEVMELLGGKSGG